MSEDVSEGHNLGEEGELLLARRGWTPGLLLDVLRCRGQHPPNLGIAPKSVAPKLRNSKGLPGAFIHREDCRPKASLPSLGLPKMFLKISLAAQSLGCSI